MEPLDLYSKLCTSKAEDHRLTSGEGMNGLLLLEL